MPENKFIEQPKTDLGIICKALNISGGNITSIGGNITSIENDIKLEPKEVKGEEQVEVIINIGDLGRELRLREKEDITEEELKKAKEANKKLKIIENKIIEFIGISKEDPEFSDIYESIYEVLKNAVIHTNEDLDEKYIGIKCSKKEGKWKLSIFNFSKGEIPEEFRYLIDGTKDASRKKAEKICSDFGEKKTKEALERKEYTYPLGHQKGIVEACGLSKLGYELIKEGKKLGYVFTVEPREPVEPRE